MTDLTQNGLLVTMTVALAKAVEWLAKALTKRSSNGASGQKSVEFWEKRMGDIVEEAVGKSFRGRNEQVREVFERANEPLYDKLDLMLQNQTEVLKKINELIVEVVRREKA